MPDVLPHQRRAVHLDQVPGVEHAEGGEDLAVQPGHRGLAGAGIAGEHQVARQRRRRQACLLPVFHHLHELDQCADILLGPAQADQLVELGEQRRQMRLRIGIWAVPGPAGGPADWSGQAARRG